NAVDAMVSESTDSPHTNSDTRERITASWVRSVRLRPDPSRTDRSAKPRARTASADLRSKGLHYFRALVVQAFGHQRRRSADLRPSHNRRSAGLQACRVRLSAPRS